MKKPLKYIFIDPINRNDSGITTYCEASLNVLIKAGISALIVSINRNERFEFFQNRIQSLINALSENYNVLIEVPETMAISSGLELGKCVLHVRLHCSKSLGDLFQLKLIDKLALSKEQKELDRAMIISAPSSIAVNGSRLIFDIPELISIYPNPIPLIKVNELDGTLPNYTDKYVLFVGRPHELKGIFILIDIAKKLRHVNFVFLLPNSDLHFYKGLPKNIKIVGMRTDIKTKLYRDAVATIIPSLFETASMVGVESIACGTPVITWGHLGITEYANDKMIITASPWDVEDLILKIQLLYSKNKQVFISSSFISNINSLFLKGTVYACNLDIINLMPKQNGNLLSPEYLVNAELAELLKRGKVMKHDYSHWRRKGKKFLREPKLFFQDSTIWRLFVKPSQTNTYQIAKTLPMNGKIEQQSGEIIKLANIEKANKSTVVGHPLIKDITVANNNNTKNIFSFIGSGRIEFKDPPSKPTGLITALFYPENDDTAVNIIINGLNSYSDFRYVQNPMLQVGTFLRTDDLPLNILERIDVKNKKLISQVDHIILIDPPKGLVNALRSCGTRQRVIVILTDDESQVPDPLHTDVLITVGFCINQGTVNNWRRLINVKNIELVYLAIRKAIQEGSPKSVDYLLPIKGFSTDSRSLLTSINPLYHQGIIITKFVDSPVGASVNAIVVNMVRNTSEVALLESVYLKYKTLCDGDLNNQNLIQLITYCLYDGVIFDVRS